MSRRKLGDDAVQKARLKRNPSISIIPAVPPPSIKPSDPNGTRRQTSPAHSITSSSRMNGTPKRIPGSPSGYTSPGKEELTDDEDSVCSRTSVQSGNSLSTYSSSASKRSNQAFKDRAERKLQKPDYTYHYQCKSANKESMWIAEFEKPLEEFVYPSLQNHSSAEKTKSKQVARNLSQKQLEPSEQAAIESESEVQMPTWKHVQTDEKMVHVVDEDTAHFKEDLNRGEKFIRESIQRNYRKGLKQEAEAEKRKNTSSTAIKKANKIKSKFTILEKSVGMVVGENNSFFLPKPADEVVSLVLVLFALIVFVLIVDLYLVQIFNYEFVHQSEYGSSI